MKSTFSAPVAAGKPSQGSYGGRPQQSEALPAHPWAFTRYFVGRYWYFLLPMILFEIAQAGCQILVPKAIQGLIDTAQAREAGQAVLNDFYGPIGFFVLLSIGVLVASRASGALLVITGPRLRRRVRYALYRYLQNHSQRFFAETFAGSLANRIQEVAMAVNHSLWTVMFDFLPITVSFTVSLVLFLQADMVLGVALGVWITIYVAVSFALARKCRAYSKDFAACRSTVTGRVVDAVTNITTTKLFAHGAYEREHLFEALTSELKSARRTYWFMEGMRWFQFIATLSLQVAMILLALKVWLQGEISTGEFVMIASLALLMINEARGLTRRFLEFFEYLGNIDDGVKAIVRPQECLDRVGAQDLVVKQAEIRFEHVGFRYRDEWVFKDLQVVIPAGQRVGLVGYSGSGKTTFVNLLLRLYEPQRGCILIDGQDILSCTQNSLRRQISMIPQDPMLFHRTLLDNIRYGRLEATDEEVVAAARKSFCHEFITAQEQGYQALVGERGVKLSGGQRQRIAIARAFVKAAPILVMDEATSSLDSYSEKIIQDALKDVMAGCTAIVIAHRLSTVAHLDRILVFHEGQIVEDGSHEELLGRKGHYAKLWSMQTNGLFPS